MGTDQGEQQPGDVRLVWAIMACLALFVWWFAANTKDPLEGQAPAYASYLSEQKDICESRARGLKEAGIDGEAEYERAQLAANGCIAYLQTVLDQGGGDRGEIEKQFDRLDAASVRFQAWANKKLRVVGADKPTTPALDLTALLKLFDAQERERRKAVREGLEKYKFRSWAEIKAE